MPEATTHAEERAKELGAQESARQRMLAGAAKGGKAVREAFSLKAQVDSGADAMAEVRAMAQKALPRIMANMIRMASGEKMAGGKPAPAVAQVQATKLVAGAAGLALDAPDGGSDGALSEMSLSNLESDLGGLLSKVRELRAAAGIPQVTEAQGEVVPQLGTSAAGDGSPDPLPG